MTDAAESKQQISVHDNFLVSYEVHCERREIRFETEYRDRGHPFELTKVLFQRVEAYQFRFDNSANIIFDVDEVPAMSLYAEHATQLQEGTRYGWPGDWAQTPEAANGYFRLNAVRGFVLHSSFGMDGWVLARGMQMETRLADGLSR